MFWTWDTGSSGNEGRGRVYGMKKGLVYGKNNERADIYNT
jgi:hypothetical protein